MAEIARLPVVDVVPGTAVRLDAGGPAGVCVVRIGDDFYALGDRCSHANVSLALGDRCSHANVSLALGEVDADDRTIECWKHGSAFSLESGQPQSLPAVKPVPVYQVTLEGDDVVVHIP
jgi:nitrite reductase/ring-hydroxylating ferredoxin subunit